MAFAAWPCATATTSTCIPSRASRSARYFPEVVARSRGAESEAVRARWRDRRAADGKRFRSTICCSAFIPAASRVKKLAAGNAGTVSRVRSAGDARRTELAAAPLASGGRRSKHSPQISSSRKRRFRLSPATTSMPTAQVMAEASRRRSSTASSPSASTCPIRPATRACRRSRNCARADCVVGGFRYDDKANARWSARCCSASTTTRACSPRRLHLGDHRRESRP